MDTSCILKITISRKYLYFTTLRTSRNVRICLGKAVFVKIHKDYLRSKKKSLAYFSHVSFFGSGTVSESIKCDLVGLGSSSFPSVCQRMYRGKRNGTKNRIWFLYKSIIYILYLSNRPHFRWVYRRDKPPGMLEEHEKSL